MKKFALTDGSKLILVPSATTVEQAVGIMIKRIMRDEYQMKPNADGKIVTPENLQLCYNDWADTAIENMENDCYEAGDYTISLDEMTDNWSNRYWVVAKDDGEKGWSQDIDNSDQSKMIFDRIRPQVTEKTFTITK